MGNLFISASFFLALGHGMGFIATPLYAGLLGASVFELGIVGTLFSLFYALCCPFSGVASDRLGRRGILTLGCLFTALSFSFMGITRSMGFFLALNALAGSTAALAWPILMAWFAETQGKGGLGRKLGSFNVAMSLGMTIGPFLDCRSGNLRGTSESVDAKVGNPREKGRRRWAHPGSIPTSWRPLHERLR